MTMNLEKKGETSQAGETSINSYCQDQGEIEGKYNIFGWPPDLGIGLTIRISIPEGQLDRSNFGPNRICTKCSFKNVAY